MPTRPTASPAGTDLAGIEGAVRFNRFAAEGQDPDFTSRIVTGLSQYGIGSRHGLSPGRALVILHHAVAVALGDTAR